MNAQHLLALVSVLIIIGLSFYAGMLIKRINLQKRKQVENSAKESEKILRKNKQRNHDICESIRFIARATAQKQCNVSEASIRLSVLLETLLVEPKIDVNKNYPALSALFEKIKGFATHTERKKMDKKLLKQQDKQRQLFENEFESAIIEEVKSLENFAI